MPSGRESILRFYKNLIVYAASVRETELLAPKSFTDELLPFPTRVIGVSALDLTEELIHGAP